MSFIGDKFVSLLLKRAFILKSPLKSTSVRKAIDAYKAYSRNAKCRVDTSKASPRRQWRNDAIFALRRSLSLDQRENGNIVCVLELFDSLSFSSFH